MAEGKDDTMTAEVIDTPQIRVDLNELSPEEKLEFAQKGTSGLIDYVQGGKPEPKTRSIRPVAVDTGTAKTPSQTAWGTPPVTRFPGSTWNDPLRGGPRKPRGF